MAGAEPLTLRVASVGHAAAVVPVVVVVPGGSVGAPEVDVAVGAGVMAEGAVDVGAAVGIVVSLLFAPPAVLLPGVVEPLGVLPVGVPTVWLPPMVPGAPEQPMARTAGVMTAKAAASTACDSTRIAFVRLIMAFPWGWSENGTRRDRMQSQEAEPQAVICVGISAIRLCNGQKS